MIITTNGRNCGPFQARFIGETHKTQLTALIQLDPRSGSHTIIHCKRDYFLDLFDILKYFLNKKGLREDLIQLRPKKLGLNFANL